MSFLIALLLILIGITSFVYAAGVKIAAVLFKGRHLSWKAISLVVLSSMGLGGFAEFVSHFGTLIGLTQSISGVLYLICTAAALILPVAIIKRSLHTRLLQSTTLFAVANVMCVSLVVVTGLPESTFAFQTFKIGGAGMEPTLALGDHLLAGTLIYRLRAPTRHEVVVFKYPKDPSRNWVSRVIGVPGDTIEIRDKVLVINGEVQKEDYVKHVDDKIFPASVGPRDNMGPTVVPPNSLFVLGDNRDASYDGRYWKFVDMSSLKGKASYIYWSKDRSRIGMELR